MAQDKIDDALNVERVDPDTIFQIQSDYKILAWLQLQIQACLIES
jgi:hypothetical protein